MTKKIIEDKMFPEIEKQVNKDPFEVILEAPLDTEESNKFFDKLLRDEIPTPLKKSTLDIKERVLYKILDHLYTNICKDVKLDGRVDYRIWLRDDEVELTEQEFNYILDLINRTKEIA